MKEPTLADALAHPWVQEDLAHWKVSPDDIRRWLGGPAAEQARITESVLARMMIEGAVLCRIDAGITLDDPTWAGLGDEEGKH